MKKCESEIETIFENQIIALNKRKNALLTELHKIAEKKRNILSKQESDLETNLSKTKNVYKECNLLIKTPIALEEVDKRKQKIIKNSNRELSDTFTQTPNTSAKISVSADVQYLKKVCSVFFWVFGNISFHYKIDD